MHHQAGVHFENFTEVKLGDILLTGTGHRDSPGQTGMYGRSIHVGSSTSECHELQ